MYKTIDNPPPFKHQEEGTNFALGKEFSAIFMEQGLGKTRLLIDLASNLFLQKKIDSVLLIAPNMVAPQWIAEQLPLFSPVPYKPLLFRKGASRRFDREFREFAESQDRSELRWLVTNVEGFSYDTYVPYFKFFLKKNKTLLAVDEVHLIKSLDAKRTQNIIFGLSDLTKIGRRVTAVHPLSVCRSVLTGTPVANAPFDIYAIFEFLSPGFWGMPFSSFKSQYGLEKTDTVPGSTRQFKRKLSLKEMRYIREASGRGLDAAKIAQMYGVNYEDINYLITHPDVHVPYKNLPELKAKIAPYSFIRKKTECMDLPEKIYDKVSLEMNDEQKTVYKSMVKSLEAEYQGVELTALNSLTLIVRLAQITSGFFPHDEEHTGKVLPIGKNNVKIDALLSHMEEYQEFPSIVVSRFVAEAELAASEVKAKFPDQTVELIIGDVPMVKRNKIIDAFKGGEVDVVVATQKPIGTGLNLQRSSLMYFLSNSYSFVDRSQAEDRIHRPGQESRCSYVDFLCTGTIDERIYEVLLQKKDLLEYMRGRSFREFIGK